MKKFVALTAVATAALAATPALAQAPQGPRVEALVGYDAPRIRVNDSGINGTFKDEGVVYGVGAGYDFALGNRASLGVDVEASDSTVKEKPTSPARSRPSVTSMPVAASVCRWVPTAATQIPRAATPMPASAPRAVRCAPSRISTAIASAAARSSRWPARPMSVASIASATMRMTCVVIRSLPLSVPASKRPGR